MKVLVIKTSSLGDVLHTLPALTDAASALPGIRFDWVVEEGFVDISAWHPAVDEVIPVALRRWKHHPLRVLRAGEPQAAVRHLRRLRYDRIIDAQGLVKSAVIARFARGPRYGLDRASAREPLAALAYEHKIPVARKQHAVLRVRQLFASALDYVLPDSQPDYGLDVRFETRTDRDYLVFLHGTTWPTKHWPESYWAELAMFAAGAGLQVRLPWGSAAEHRLAARIAEVDDAVEVLPRQGLGELAQVIAGARAVIGVDTGLVHLAAALGVPCITLYGATDPQLTGNVGHRQMQLQAEFPCAPCLGKQCTYKGPSTVQPACYETIGPEKLWRQLQTVLSAAD